MTDVREVVERQLNPGERVLWVGRPRAGRFAAEESRARVLFGAAFAPLALFWTHGVASVSLLGGLFQALFLVVALSMLASPLWEYWRGLRTIYAITDRRILILDGVVRDSVRSYEAAEIAAVQVRGRRGGPGSIVFRRHDVASGERPYAEPAAFRALVDTAEAARHLAALRRRHPPATPSHERDQA